MRQPEYSGQFKRDVKQAQKRGKDPDGLLIYKLEGVTVRFERTGGHVDLFDA